MINNSNPPALQLEAQESNLVERAQSGDREAFGELVLRYREGVVNVVYRMSGDADLAEDIAQEAFIRAWKKLPSYRPNAPFRNWVYRIATNAALDNLRQAKRTEDIGKADLVNAGQGIEENLEKKETAVLVQQAVLDLPLASRTVLILREYQGLSYQEISAALEIPLGTVMSRLNYARNAIKKSLSVLLEVT